MRWRLAGGSAVLTVLILLAFAVVIGTLTTGRIRGDFNDETRRAANELQDKLRYSFDAAGRATCSPDLDTFAGSDNAVIRVLTSRGEVLCRTRGAPDLGLLRQETVDTEGYRVESRLAPLLAGELAVIQYARPLSAVDRTIARVRVLLALGVLAGGGLALLAGLMVARRAIRPIAELTWTAREIERTRDPSMSVPHPEADDEVAELARTLEGMLRALDAARNETEAMLVRQREFIADVSHELRTPLTSVLANLELLADHLGGEEGEAAGAALRSTQRMRRLVADLLLLARADAGRVTARVPTDLGAVLLDAAAELEPLAEGHELTVDVHERAVVQGARDELHRLAVNLISNALRHTPAGTHVHAAVRRRDGEVELVVADDGPGIAPEIRNKVFERFVRGGGDRAGSSGLGLAIVRAVAEAHGGSVSLEPDRPDGRGARFIVRLPASAAAAQAPRTPAAAR
ncbi:MAG TPA: HAMP domain-containing sensor histidine kinase [Solirubrobacteraceae bacterium]|nr:HAMP domain-containing sensor histidine kinase [Solirubrobacteraceae bacterium]